MSNIIEGKIVVITGASSGLGEATARLLSAQGASIVLGARRVDRLQSLADELTASGRKAIAVTTDVTHREQVKSLVDTAVQKFRRIDVMINNAGLMPQSPLERLKIDEWNQMIDVNIKGVLYGIAAALPYMKQQKAGRIIAAGVTKEVTFEPVDGSINNRIDDAYRAKYHGSPYLRPMIGARARSATVKVMPRQTTP
jgi:NADP-dependent 3-hydroxy acid dehydrogenase YdfG